MRRNALITCLICSVLLVAACSSKPFREETSEFAAFLQLNFQYTLPVSGKGIYMLIPSCQCKNCIVLHSKKLPLTILNKIHVVSSIDTAYFPGFKHYLFDNDNKVMRLSFLHYANCIVLTEGIDISGIIRLRDFEYQMDSLETNWLNR